MSLKDFIPSAIRDQIFEEEPEATAKPVPAQSRPQSATPIRAALATPANMQITSAGGYSSQPPVSSTTMSVDDVVSVDVLLQTIRANTDFYTTPVGKKVQRILTPLEDTGLSDEKKMGVVVKAGAADGITPEGIIKTLQGTLEALEAEDEKWAATMKASRSNKVDAVHAQIDEINNNIVAQEKFITESRAKMNALSAQTAIDEAKIRQADANFQTAYTTRKDEIQKSIAHYGQIFTHQGS